MHRTFITNLSKRITIPKLSPTHTRAKIVQIVAPNNEHIQEYDPIMILQCSSDVITEGFREYPNHEPVMIIDSQEEGIVCDIQETDIGKWLEVGTVIGKIDDDDPVDGDWIWQAYHHDGETQP